MTSHERHTALQEFSQDHQLFLLEVQNIRWLIEGDERAATLDEVVESALTFWRNHGEPHLREEEELLYPLYLRYVPAAKDDIDALITDHNWLRDKFEELASLPRYENCAPILHSIAEYMTNHVRQEEQLIYTAIQNGLDESVLDDLAVASTNFRGQHRPDYDFEAVKEFLPSLDEL